MPSKAWTSYLRYFRGTKLQLCATILLSLLQSLLILPIAVLARRIFNQILISKDFTALTFSVASIFLLYLLSHGVQLFNRRLSLKTTKLAIQRLRNDLIDRIYHFPRSAYVASDHGKLQTHIVQDTERVDVMSNALITQWLPNTVLCAGLGLLLLHYDPLLFGALTAFSVLAVLFASRLHPKIKQRVKDFHRDFENFNKGILFVLKKMDLTRSQAAEELEIRKQRQNVENLRRASYSMAWRMTAFGLILNSLLVTAGLIVLLVGGWQIQRSQYSLGDLMTFFVILGLMKDPMGRLIDAIPQLLEGQGSLTALFAILSLGWPKAYSGRQGLLFRGKIELRGVKFHYAESPLLEKVDLQIQSGKSYAIVGASGAGKTTLLNLIFGFYQPVEGCLLAEGIPYSDLDLKDLRRQMGIILQNAPLFSGTVAENIQYGLPDASAEEMRRAAMIAMAHDFIQDLPLGYDTPIGEEGLRLSGGQCQRIAIARALLKKPALLILDEPTNHLQPELIQEILAKLRTEFKDGTILIVSHDDQVIRMADEVFFLKDGILKKRVSGEETNEVERVVI